MKFKKIFMAVGLPVLAAASLVGTGYATWYFNTTDVSITGTGTVESKVSASLKWYSDSECNTELTALQMHLDQKNSDSNGYSSEANGIWFSVNSSTEAQNTIYLKYAPSATTASTGTGTVSVSASINNTTVGSYVSAGTVSLTKVSGTDVTETGKNVTLSGEYVFSIDLTKVFSYTTSYPGTDEGKYDEMVKNLTGVTDWFTLTASLSTTTSTSGGN